MGDATKATLGGFGDNSWRSGASHSGCLSGAGGEASFRDDAERAIEISQTLTVAEGIPHHPHPIGIVLFYYPFSVFNDMVPTCRISASRVAIERPAALCLYRQGFFMEPRCLCT